MPSIQNTSSSGLEPGLGPSDLLDLLRCLECGGPVRLVSLSEQPECLELGADGHFACESCGEGYPMTAGTVRMLPRQMGSEDVKQRTADSFAYEWEQFGGLRDQWRKNFVDYMQPHSPESFSGRLLLDVGTGSGRHAFQAAELGARVAAVDLGRSIDVARANLPPEVLTVQADAEQLPFEPGTFDFVMSIGVLHHLPDPQRAFERIVPLARPGGHVHVYLYWVPEQAWHARILGLVGAVRKLTVRLPHRLLHALCLPLAAMLALAVVWPYRFLRRFPRLRRVAAAFPLKTYADYPFGVLVNDQFDRFSAPIENRYTQAQVRAWLERAGLEEIQVLPNWGWLGSGRKAAISPIE